ncbi:MAG: hypothetical protein AAF478_00005 [Pseudomonadota bacterium]
MILEKPESCLNAVMEAKQWELERLAAEIGDDCARLRRVLEGEEELGQTATLALLAVVHGIPAIARDA